MVSVVCKKDKCRLKRKKRKAGMKFAVGMIVRILSSNKIGVIIRWEKLELSLRTKKSSLYYTVLCDCKKTHCVPEENLRRVVKSIRIPINTDITGIYFSTFKGTYYMPNKILASEYPDDVLYLTYKKQLTFK
ncbi:hypothetical protein X777_04031 [Ooceraea biroi]|uniref:Uncharacterized protein n=2 Tax=Ooceraea biroi TaxID=2015173 RepID=A0A026WJK4_OOCBI|nr:hypothetical protein X777_04031 [Ooceraea biroi]